MHKLANIRKLINDLLDWYVVKVLVPNTHVPYLDLDTKMTEKRKYADKVMKDFSVSDVEANLKEISATLNYFVIQLLSANEVGTLENIFAGAAVYASNQASRIISNLKTGATDIDVIAWSTRCLFETYLFLHDILQNPYQEAEDLILKWVEEGNLVIKKTMACLYSESDIEINQLVNELKSYGLPTRNKILAQKADQIEEYDAFYRLLCTYTHPSMFLLFGSPSNTRDNTVNNLILVRACHYMCLICDCIAYIVDHAGGGGEEYQESQDE